MDGKVIVITSGKGGVGKTTTTANLGAGLAQRGPKVCLVDADIGLRNLDVVMGLENRIVYDLVNVVEGQCSLRKALIKDKRSNNLFLLPAAQTKEKDAITPDQMNEVCRELRQEFDYVLIDCPAGIEQGFKNAVSGADEAIIISTPEVSAVRDADRIVGLLESHELYEPRLIINRMRADMVRKGDMMDIDDMIDILRIPLLGIVPDDEQIIISANRGEPIVLDRRGRAAAYYVNILDRFERGDEVSLLTLGDAGWVGRLRKMIGMGRE